MTTSSPATIANDIANAAGPGYTITLSPGQYGDLWFNHNRPCTLIGCAGSTVRSIRWGGGPPTGNQQVKGVTFAGGNGSALSMLDDVSNVLVEDCIILPGYAMAFSIERADPIWPQPRNIRIHRLRGRGMTSLGCIVGACDSVFLDDVALDCRLCRGGNGFYLHDKQATNLRLRDVLCYGSDGLPACGIRCGAANTERAVSEGCLVNFAAGHNVQSIRGLVSVNAKRNELEIGDYGPLYIEGARLSNNLTHSGLDGDGPAHHNVGIGGFNLARVEIRNSTAYTGAVESGTCFASSSNPEYRGVVEMGFRQARPGSPLEWGSDVSAKYTFFPAPAPQAPAPTVGDFAAASNMTVAEVFDRMIPVREIYEYMET